MKILSLLFISAGVWTLLTAISYFEAKVHRRAWWGWSPYTDEVLSRMKKHVYVALTIFVLGIPVIAYAIAREVSRP